MEVTAMAATEQEGETPILRARVPRELKAAARKALGQPNASDTVLVRAALATLAGLDVESHAAPLPTYRRPRRAAA
jgi:hypothetical protein